MNRRNTGRGGFTVSDNQGDVVVANGDHAYAAKVTESEPSLTGRAAIDHELARLRTQLDELRESDPGRLRPEELAGVEQDTEALRQAVLRDQPEPDEITRRLGRLSIVLGGVAGLAETVVRLGAALRGLIRLG